jgi:hypothetical protein
MLKQSVVAELDQVEVVDNQVAVVAADMAVQVSQ